MFSCCSRTIVVEHRYGGTSVVELLSGSTSVVFPGTNVLQILSGRTTVVPLSRGTSVVLPGNSVVVLLGHTKELKIIQAI